MTFKEWLTKQKQQERDDLVGDFARAVAADPSFPNSVNRNDNAQYCEGFPDAVRESFEEAWAEYAQQEEAETA